LLLIQDSFFAVGQIATDLLHPESVGTLCDSAELNTPGRKTDEKENYESLESLHRPDFHGEEIGSNNLVEVTSKEFLPGCLSLPFGSGLDTVLFENTRDCIRRNVVANQSSVADVRSANLRCKQ
jgi:hypothetical protein